MSAGSLLSIGTRAMFANYAALQTTGHNIANANVEGYSRQRVELQTSQGQFTGAGFFGKGVDVATVTRMHNEFLTREAASASSVAAADATRAEQLARLENVFPPGEAGLGYATSELLNAMVDLANQPADTSAREVVLARAQDMATRYASAGAQLDTLQAGVVQDLTLDVAKVNELTQRIAQVNDQIAQVAGYGQPPNDLLDQRDQLIKELSGLVQVTTLPADDGTVGVFLAGGQRLVLGTQVTQLAVVSDEFDISRLSLAVVEQGQARALPPSLVAGGSIGGLLRFQNEDLVAARNALGRLAAAVATSLNEQQALGLDLRTPPGSGAPIFSFGAPQALPAAGNARDASGNFISSVTLAIADASALMASEYELAPDSTTPGQYLLTRRSDGLVRSIASGDTVDGLTITVGPPAPAAGERFLLQPVSRAAVDMRRVLDDARGIASASPLQASTGLTNTGTAAIGSLTIVDPAVDPDQTATITFTSGSGDYAWELRDRVSNALLSSGTGTWQAGQPIALNGFELQLSGVPASGDTVSVTRTAFPAQNNGNALAMAALRDEAMVGGQTITDAYASVMAGVGIKVQTARTAADISAVAADAAQAQVDSASGVNLDEEAARLLQFQQSYQAAAKILQVAQSVFDTLLETAGR
ncbi:MAG TPA: flagellar hook-associated protein FlgK [Burkholderiaceae bacterium]|nr:flagellar hook-associated protein FlgK [Burkholderiaceae bacterium]